jgi:hypothetical protein
VTEEERRLIWQGKIALEVAEACLSFVADLEMLTDHAVPLALRLVRRAIRAKEDALDGLD